MARYDIAIIGMGCVVPEANNVRKYWENIVSGDSYIKEMPESIWHMRHYYNPDQKAEGKTYTMMGAFISGFEFPYKEYRLPPRAMQEVDPAQPITLEATKEALRDAGLDFFSPELKEGVTVIGSSGVDGFAHATAFLDRQHYFNKVSRELRAGGVPEHIINRLFDDFTAGIKSHGHVWNSSIAAVGAVPSSVSNRVAQVFGIHGFNMTVDAACGSSFVALDIACQALMAGDANIAVTGGTDLGTNPAIYIGFSKVGGLSPNGWSNPFDASANGLVIGEGCGIVVLKRLEDALRDGNKIHAVIRGIGSSSDGSGQAIYAPSAEGRARALKAALRHAEVEPHQVQYIEAHATSTVVGDANEYDAISMAYGRDEKRKSSNPLYLGSVKAQIGHLKAAAGVAGLIKAVLAMEHGKVPHLPRFKELTPRVTRPCDKLKVPTELLPWQPQEDGSRYAAVTSSGFGGANYHTILEQRESYTMPPPRREVAREMAIVGTSVRLPGAVTPDTFWQNISSGKDVFKPIDAKKLSWSEHVDAGPENERITTKMVATLDDYKVDCLRYKMLPKSFDQISPTQFLALDLADRLFEQKGLEFKAQKNVAVCLGSMHDDYYPTIQRPMVSDEYNYVLSHTATAGEISADLLEKALNVAKKEVHDESPRVTEHTLPGWMANITAGRVANKLNCIGPNFTIDTACSSGVAALVPAMYQLMFGDVDMVLSGGLNRQTSFSFTCGVCALGAVAKEVARPYDERGDGFLISEGGVFFLLKRLADAKRDGDEILAVIRNVGGASEVYGKSLVAPSEAALGYAADKALLKAHVDPSTIGVVETHGSGNKVSDIVEAKVIAQKFRPQKSDEPVYITAVKSHVGHLYGGSGATSLLSTVLALKNHKAPGIRNLEKLRPELSATKELALPINQTTDMSAKMTSGAVTSLGLGGAEYVVIVSTPEALNESKKEAPKNNEAAAPAGAGKLALLKAASATPAIAYTKRQGSSMRADDIAGNNVFLAVSERLEDMPLAIGHAMQKSPIPLFVSEGLKANHRLAVSFKDQDELRSKLMTVIRMLMAGADLKPLAAQGVYMAALYDDSREPLTFCFPGQGTHYIGMGRFLYEENPIFRAVLDEVQELTMAEFGFDLLAHIYGNPNDPQIVKELGSLVGAQLSLFAVEQGMAQVLTAMGVKPRYLIGQSFGEISALTFAGVWSLETALKAIVARIKATEEITKRGPELGMLSLICPAEVRDAILAKAGDKVYLTNINAPTRFIVAGDLAAIKKIIPEAEAMGADVKLLPIASAFHSPYMAPVRAAFEADIARLPCEKPLVPILSTVTGAFIEPDNLNSESLARHLGSQLVTPINLVRDINKLYDNGAHHYIEVGPGWSLSKMVDSILEGREHIAFPTIHPKLGDREIFNRALAIMMVYGHVSSAADRKNLPGMFSSEFLEYMRASEPAVLHLLEEVRQRYLQQFVNISELAALEAPAAPAARASLPMGQSAQNTVAISQAAMPESRADNFAAKPVALAPASAAAPDTTIAAAEGASSAKSAAEWATLVKERLVESTGYPLEMLEDNLELEADLGIDSVQRAEIWMGLVKDYQLDPTVRPEGKATIAAMAEGLEKAGRGGATQAANVGAAAGQAAAGSAAAQAIAPAAAISAAAPDTTIAAAESASSAKSAAEWASLVKERLVESTGYPLEMLEDNLELEADLGIDSVQRAEIWMGLVKDYQLDPTVRPEGKATIAAMAAGLEKAGRGAAAETAPASAAARPLVAPLADRAKPLSAEPFTLPERHKEALLKSPNQLFVSTAVPVEPGDLIPQKCRKVLIIVSTRKPWVGKFVSQIEAQKIKTTVIKTAELLNNSSVQLGAMVKDHDTIIYAAHRDLYSQKGQGQELVTAILKETSTIYDVFKALAPELQKQARRVIVPIAMDGAFGSEGAYDALVASFPAGFVRCLRREITTSSFLLLDGGDNWIDALKSVLPYESKSFELGYSQYGLVKPVLTKLGASREYRPILERDDTLVVTGGARGIVFECVLALAEATGCRLVLTGRTKLLRGESWLSTPKENLDTYLRNFEMNLVRNKEVANLGEAKRRSAAMRTEWEVNNNLERAAALGISAEYRRIDVTDSVEFTAFLKEIDAKYGIKGIVHGAGVQKSHLLADLSDEQITATLRTKLSPMLDIIATLDIGKLKLLSVFSSIAGLFGNAGQTDYALSNDLLDSFTRWLAARYPNLAARSIQWTAWVGTGMVTAAEAKRFAESGLVPLDVPSGVALYMNGVTGSNWQVLSALNAASAFADTRPILPLASSARPRSALLEAQPGDGNAVANFVSSEDVYLEQHRVQLKPVAPGTFIAEIFAEAAKKTGFVLGNIHIRRPLWVREENFAVEVVRNGDELVLLPKERPNLPEKALLNLSYASAKLLPREENTPASQLKALPKEIKQLAKEAQSAEVTFYQLLDSHFSSSLKTGPIFRGIKALTFDNDSCLALMVLTESARALINLPSEMVIDPVMADMAVQAAAAWVMQVKNVMAVPYEFGLMQSHAPVSTKEAICILKLYQMDIDGATMDVAVREPGGRLLFTIDKLVLKTIGQAE